MQQAGEILRRWVFNGLDLARGGELARLKAVNKREIMEGILPEYRERRIKALLDYAVEHSPYYKHLAGYESLQDFPVMKKMDYNENRDDILCENFADKKDRLYKLSSSGSTGAPFIVLCDGNKMNHVNMNFISFMELNGFRFGMKRGEFRVWIEGKNKRSKWTTFKTNLVMIDISNMGDEALGKICDDIKKKRIQVLVCYASALGPLTDYIRRKEIDVKKWSVEMVYAMGESLSQKVYDDVTEIFGFHPVRSYGNNENGFMGCQVDGEDGYTVDLYNFNIEMLKLDSDEPVADGELGRIVVTDYYNKAFPMIRYDTGDTGIYHEKVENGRVTAKFAEIYGRRGSLVYNTKGEPLSMHVFLNVLLDLQDSVHQAKCIQWEEKFYQLKINADMDKIDEEAVVALYRRYLGDDAEIKVTYVDEIPIEASGKRFVCENKCKKYNP